MMVVFYKLKMYAFIKYKKIGLNRPHKFNLSFIHHTSIYI